MKLTQSDIRMILRSLDSVRELTDLLRRAHFDVPYNTVYGAAGAEMNIREKILSVALADVVVEQEAA